MRVSGKKIILILLLAVFAAAGFTYLFRGFPVSAKVDENKGSENTEALAERILRFHVIANSDSTNDQELKLKVKTAVIEYLQQAPVTSLEETKEFVVSQSDEIKEIAAQVIKENGYHYAVNVTLTNCYFPTKSYGDLTFPNGYYEALRIEIGEAAGKNWWCVLYPPLCFVDATHSVVPEESKEMLKETLGDDTYETLIVTDEELAQDTQEGQVEVRFKLLDWLQSMF